MTPTRRKRRGRRRRPTRAGERNWTNADRLRQYRGLLRHAPAVLAEGKTRRGLPTLGRLERYDGHCRWCGRPCAARSAWHPACIPADWAATAQSARLRQYFGRRRGSCPCGWPGTELDHIDALSLASASGDRKRYLRALTFANLRWLCHACHAAKTGDDRRRLNDLLIAQAERRKLAALRADEPIRLPAITEGVTS